MGGVIGPPLPWGLNIGAARLWRAFISLVLRSGRGRGRGFVLLLLSSFRMLRVLIPRLFW